MATLNSRKRGRTLSDSTSEVCRFDKRCQRIGCKFKHPERDAGTFAKTKSIDFEENDVDMETRDFTHENGDGQNALSSSLPMTP